jgi:hypothetical protein
LLGGHADARVRDRHADPVSAEVVRLACHRDPDSAPLGELAGVAGEVEERLAEPRRIGPDHASVGGTLHVDLVPVLRRERPDRREHVLDQGNEGDRLQ